MKLDWERTGLTATGMLIVGLLWLTSTDIKASPQQTPQPDAGVRMSEEVFQDVQMLKGIPADEFLDTMGMFASALLYDCVSCHAKEILSDPKAFAKPTARITQARRMIGMMNEINKQYFFGQKRVTCFTCHGGDDRPKSEPNLDLQYGGPVDDPYTMTFFPSFYAPDVDEVFAKYLKAMGGAAQMAKLTSVVATGTYASFDTELMEIPVEISARAPNQLMTIAKGRAGNNVTTYDGRNGWRVQPDTPLPLLALSRGNLFGAAIEAMVWFPAGIQRSFSQWQAGTATIGDRDVVVLQGANPQQPPVRLYFDESGRLVRLMHWNPTAVGSVPTKIDYTDYREVAGVQMPFQWTKTWTNNQVIIQLKEIRPNVPMDAARFGKPPL